jgi:hypothetical protein
VMRVRRRTGACALARSPSAQPQPDSAMFSEDTVFLCNIKGGLSSKDSSAANALMLGGGSVQTWSGFQTQAHFTTVFRKVVGKTPKCWRNANLVRGE